MTKQQFVLCALYRFVNRSLKSEYRVFCITFGKRPVAKQIRHDILRIMRFMEREISAQNMAGEP